MLEPIKRQPASDADELVARLFLNDGSIARCEKTGALLLKSRGQYTLVLPEEMNLVPRHWSRRTVRSDEDAIERANKSLQRILKQQAQA